MTTATLPPETEQPESATETLQYELKVSNDKLTVTLDCPQPQKDLSGYVFKIMQDFDTLEIPEHPDENQVTALINAVCPASGDIQDQPVIMGAAPTFPVDAALTWSKDYFASGWAVDEESGAINFWEKLDLSSVHAEEELAVLTPPVSGEAGLNVFGNKIPVDKPLKVRLRNGKGVRMEEDEAGVQRFYALCNGRVRYQDGTATVDDVFIVKGDVDLEQGNINHTGTVQIDGDVKTGATINAEGDVVVKGMCEPANITCGGKLSVGGGILGSPEYKISTGGGLLAKYVSEVIIRSESDIMVTNEIAHADVETRGRVRVCKGRIAGGRVLARQGIRVKEAGASGSSDTILIAGVDPTLTQLVAEHKEKILKMEEGRDKILEAVKGAAQNPQALDEAKRKLFAGLQQKANNLDKAIISEEEIIQAITKEALADAVEEVVILAELWSGTTIQLGNYQTVIRHSILKPRIVQRRKSKVQVFPLGEGNMPED
jgi:uncharacterized protein